MRVDRVIYISILIHSNSAAHNIHLSLYLFAACYKLGSKQEMKGVSRWRSVDAGQGLGRGGEVHDGLS